MKRYYKAIFLIYCLIPLTTSAIVITDGSLGNQVTLNGSEYKITPDLGKQVGSNLFHSFEQFNLDIGETALFSGGLDIQNVISRITNNQPSYINGTIRSILPNAALYFINPAGIIFGEHANLDLLGSFYASSADMLHLSDGGEFNARFPHFSLLTTAPVKDFGFLTDTPAPLQLIDSHLSVPVQQNLTLIGGDLNLQHANLQAETGHINLISVAGKSTTTVNEINSNAIYGNITLQGSELNTSGEGGGRIWIRGGQFISNDSMLQANTLGKFVGQGIDISTTGKIDITGEQVALSSITSGDGDAGAIHLSTPELKMHGSIIDSSSLSAGKSGDIYVQTEHTQLTQGAAITNETFATGASGSIDIVANQSLELIGKRSGILNIAGRSLGADNPSWISTVTFGDRDAGNIFIHAGDIYLTTGIISSMSLGTGNGGNLSVYGNKLRLLDGGLIDCLGMTHGGAGVLLLILMEILIFQAIIRGLLTIPGLEILNTESGINSVTFGIKNAGNINISAHDLTINATAITASTLSDGDAGFITINAENIYLKQGGQIDSTSGLMLGDTPDTLMVGQGNGGSIYINASKTISIQDRVSEFDSGIFTSTHSSQGKAGNIEINAPRLFIKATSGVATHSQGSSNAGYIHIRSDDIILSNPRVKLALNLAMPKMPPAALSPLMFPVYYI
ncbi:MAG: filamentous hemagglutinin N-terminal domain-containing protein [Thiotrichaceae bacterium]